MYIALNKRTKSSDPYITEITAYNLNTFERTGQALRKNTTCRFIGPAPDTEYVAVFTLTYAVIYDKVTLKGLQKIPYKSMGIDGVFQNGFVSLDSSKLILSFFEP